MTLPLPNKNLSDTDTAAHEVAAPAKRKPGKIRKLFFWASCFLVILLICGRLSMPLALRWYVNRTIDQSPLYEGRIGDITVHLWRGAYTINDVRLIKRNGNIPVPLLAVKQLDLALEWKHLIHGKIVGRVLMDQPQLNFVDAPGPDSSDDQTGVGPWLQIIRDLFPFRINSTEIKDGSVHFLAYQIQPPVDVYLSHLDATVDNLTNIYDQTTPLVSTVNATALAMDQAKLQYNMKLDPFSYRPTFQMAVQLLGLDVQKINNLTRAYGKFDFEQGFFDLVLEVDAKEGHMEGYVKPLFRNIRIFSPQDFKEDNVFELFVEAAVGVTTEVLKNRSRDQFGTVVPFSGDADASEPNLLATIGNVLHNCFIRAYLPRLEGLNTQNEELHFEKGSILEPASVGDTN